MGRENIQFVAVGFRGLGVWGFCKGFYEYKILRPSVRASNFPKGFYNGFYNARDSVQGFLEYKGFHIRRPIIKGFLHKGFYNEKVSI